MLKDKQIVWAIHEMMKEIGPVTPTLDSRTDFQYLISVILSAQATDISVNKVTPVLFSKYPTPESLATANVKDLEKIIKSVGLYHNKAKNIKICAQQIINDFHGVVPKTMKAIMSLAGAGRKTANVVLGDRFNVPSFAVDTHVSAISKRLYFVPKNASTLDIEKKITSVLDENEWITAHHTMIEFGRKYSMKLAPENEVSDLIIRVDKINVENKRA